MSSENVSVSFHHFVYFQLLQVPIPIVPTSIVCQPMILHWATGNIVQVDASVEEEGQMGQLQHHVLDLIEDIIMLLLSFTLKFP